VLGSVDRPLREAYDVAVLDLDGVVYVGPDPVSGAPEALNDAQARGMHLAFVTNNAARTPGEIADQLRSFGVEARDEDVITSAQATARLLSSQLAAGSKVFLIGGTGLEEALCERGLTPVTERGDDVAAVAQGYGPDMPWTRVVHGAILVREGLPWVASNTDMTLPTAHGVGPGNGTLVDLVGRFSDRQPQVAGKPQAPLFEETIARVGGQHPLVIGDRLDTDIEGAVSMGWDSLLVLTGVTGLTELVAATPELRPTYVAPDLAALALAPSAPEEGDGGVRLGGWTASVDDGRMRIRGDGERADWWRVAAVAAWRHLDDTGQPVETGDLEVPQ
jgi:HAD superfamily hydrolase (TIGR01450 family)